MSKHVHDFYCFNFIHQFRTKNKLESHKEVRANKDFCGAVTMTLRYLQFN